MIYTYTMNNNKDYIIKYDNVKRLATEEEIDKIINAENVALNNFICLGKINEISKAEIDKIFKDENLCKEFYEMRQDLFNILMNTLEGDKYGFLPFKIVDNKYIYTNDYRVVDMEGNHIGCIFKEIDIYDLYVSLYVPIAIPSSSSLFNNFVISLFLCLCSLVQLNISSISTSLYVPNPNFILIIS